MMKTPSFTSLRLLWRRVHLWIALGFGLLVVPIGLTGTILVLAEELDRLIDPALYAVTGEGPLRSSSQYSESAVAAVPGSVVVRMRFPAGEGAPVSLLLRGGGPSAGETMRIAYLDPPTGRVLGVRDFRGTFVGLVHSFHANLLLPTLNGRAIVGWAGVGLFVSALTGLLLWWPRKGAFVRALGWRRGVVTSVNLHNVFGAWICVPLAVLAATGITLAFPEPARSVVGLFAETTPRPEQGGKLLGRPARTADDVAARALAELAGARLVSLAFPTERARVWRVQLSDGDELRSVTVEDATGAVTVLPAALPGDMFSATLRRLHEGAHNGPVWRTIVFVTGLGPVILLVTGLIMWRRRARVAAASARGSVEKVAFRLGTEQDAADREKSRDLARRLS